GGPMTDVVRAPPRRRASIDGGVAVVATVAVLWFMHAARAVFVPTLVAIYVVLMLLPVHRALEDLLPRRLGGLATLLTSLIPLVVLGGGAWVLWWAVGQIQGQRAELAASFDATWTNLREWLAGHG